MWYNLSPYYTGVDPSGMSPGVGSQLPDRVANGNFARGQRNGLTAPFFNTAAFTCPGGSTINDQANLLSAGCPLSTAQNVGRLSNSSPAIIEGPGTNKPGDHQAISAGPARRHLPRLLGTDCQSVESPLVRP